MHLRSRVTLLLFASLVGAGTAASPSLAGPPTRLGTCAFTTVKRVETRLKDERHRPIPDSGSAIDLANGVYGVSYERVLAVDRARAGDRVMTCLARLPRHCPRGDRRGRWFTTTDFRTNEAWTLSDAEHQCGGA